MHLHGDRPTLYTEEGGGWDGGDHGYSLVERSIGRAAGVSRRRPLETPNGIVRDRCDSARPRTRAGAQSRPPTNAPCERRSARRAVTSTSRTPPPAAAAR